MGAEIDDASIREKRTAKERKDNTVMVPRCIGRPSEGGRTKYIGSSEIGIKEVIEDLE